MSLQINTAVADFEDVVGLRLTGNHTSGAYGPVRHQVAFGVGVSMLTHLTADECDQISEAWANIADEMRAVRP